MKKYFLIPFILIFVACQHQTKTEVAEKFDTLIINNTPVLAKEIDSLEFTKYYSENNFDTSESKHLRNFSSLVKRIADTLFLSTNDSLFNQKLVNKYSLFDSTKHYVEVKYFFKGDFEKMNCWLMEVGFNCGSAGMVVNKKSGQHLALDPLPTISPNGGKFLTEPYHMGDGTTKVYSILNNEINQQFEISTSSGMLINCAWVDDNSIEFLIEKNNRPKYLLLQLGK